MRSGNGWAKLGIILKGCREAGALSVTLGETSLDTLPVGNGALYGLMGCLHPGGRTSETRLGLIAHIVEAVSQIGNT